MDRGALLVSRAREFNFDFLLFLKTHAHLCYFNSNLALKEREKKEFIKTCGGTLISPEHVLTTRSCLNMKEFTKVVISHVYSAYGSKDQQVLKVLKNRSLRN